MGQIVLPEFKLPEAVPADELYNPMWVLHYADGRSVPQYEKRDKVVWQQLWVQQSAKGLGYVDVYPTMVHLKKGTSEPVFRLVVHPGDLVEVWYDCQMDGTHPQTGIDRVLVIGSPDPNDHGRGLWIGVWFDGSGRAEVRRRNTNPHDQSPTVRGLTKVVQ